MGSPLLGDFGLAEVVGVEENTHEPYIHELLTAAC